MLFQSRQAYLLAVAVAERELILFLARHLPISDWDSV